MDTNRKLVNQLPRVLWVVMAKEDGTLMHIFVLTLTIALG
jgi:hypothetical protein